MDDDILYILKILFMNKYITAIDVMKLRTCTKELYNYFEYELQNNKRCIVDYAATLNLNPITPCEIFAAKIICIIDQELKHPLPYYENYIYYKRLSRRVRKCIWKGTGFACLDGDIHIRKDNHISYGVCHNIRFLSNNSCKIKFVALGQNAINKNSKSYKEIFQGGMFYENNDDYDIFITEEINYKQIYDKLLNEKLFDLTIEGSQNYKYYKKFINSGII
jgi:hypothetical protein